MKFDKSKLRITVGSFREAKALERALERALANSSMNIGVKEINKKDLTKSEFSEGTMGEMIKSALHLLISEEVEEKLFTCAKRTAYGEDKVTEDFFEPVERRELYYPIMIEITRANVLPFMKSLFSQFEGLFEKIDSILK